MGYPEGFQSFSLQNSQAVSPPVEILLNKAANCLEGAQEQGTHLVSLCPSESPK